MQAYYAVVPIGCIGYFQRELENATYLGVDRSPRILIEGTESHPHSVWVELMPDELDMDVLRVNFDAFLELRAISAGEGEALAKQLPLFR